MWVSAGCSAALKHILCAALSIDRATADAHVALLALAHHEGA